ncbi:MAG: dTDP-4-dehydrorhamnose reductase [Bacteroidales bacterium]|jgi:dTDP-4-dehydrorhamnose reductase|nr:dTDP-4-dehydrorhamnose reductase [Bacteroidales bacterium]MCI2121469.1 dTDP-4-dehydrorhamnose reductase [Bacteroidales bacterium]MCI2145266.1 dTDP-4-dehydrorhamnose reductase [Bacteroidales bacterium]
MKKILVTGACGQLGTELRNLSGNSNLFVFTDVSDGIEGVGRLNICKGDEVAKFVEENGIGTIVNCAAYTDVDRAETDRDRCFLINVEGPKNLALAAKANDASLIQISSDYVFDGRRKRGAYRENDRCRPLSVYGESKRKCEIALRRTGCKGIIIRTSWLYSPYGKNFVRTMARLGAEKEEIRVVNDQFGSPTFARDLAEAILKIIPKIGERRCDIFHYTDEGVCCWSDFAAEIMNYSGSKCKVIPVSTEEYGSKTARPAYSVLDKTLIRDTFGVETPWWNLSLKKMFQ